MIKYIIKYILIILVITSTSSAYAQAMPTRDTTGILPAHTNEAMTTAYSSDTGANLPRGDIATYFIPSIIKIMLSLFVPISMISLFIAGFIYIYSFGKTDDIDIAKNIFIYNVIAYAIASVSYGIIEGLLRFNFIS